MKKSKLLSTVFLAVATCGFAQGPNNSGVYYKNANGKTSAALKTALGKIINPHTNIGYDGLYDGYKKTDTRPDGYVRDWYSNTTHYRHVTDKAGSYSKEGDCYNREHSVPQSWFGSGVIKSDIVHVIPTDGFVNNRRSNWPFGEVASITYQSNNGYCKLGSCKTAGYSGTVFEPNDEIKGDIARIYFYMVTCYESQAAGWGHDVFSSSNNGFTKWTLDMLMRWSQQDPVDAVETARNIAVYEVQNNRNPFVDYPGLEDYIWGSKVGQPFSYDNYEGGGGDIVTVAMPVISPDEGTYYDEVQVTITSSTDDATIYYTTDTSTPTDRSNVYSGPFTLTESATVKAIAVKDGTSSWTAMATYTIRKSGGGGGEDPSNCTIGMGNTFFNCNYNGSISSSDTEDLIGTQNGITVIYSLSGGQNRYCNGDHIRLYPDNKLTVSVAQGKLSEIIFELAETSSKTLSASTGTVNGLTWTGDASSVTFNVDSGSGHMKVKNLRIKVADAAGMSNPYVAPQSGRQIVYNLQGQPVTNPTHGIYIVNGRKVVLP